MRRRLVSLALVGLGALFVAGCGGGSDVTMVTRPTDEWASGYCFDALDLLVFLVDTRDGTLGGAVTPKYAGEILTFRSGQFAGNIAKLGRPDTSDGDTSASTASDLARQEQERADRVAKATGGENPEGTLGERKQLVHDEVNDSLKAITDTTTKLGQDDGAVGAAIAASSDCDELAGDMRKHYPGQLCCPRGGRSRADENWVMMSCFTKVAGFRARLAWGSA